MKLLFVSVLASGLLVTAWAPATGGAPRRAADAVTGGKEYVRLTDWAKAHDAEVRWVKREETLQVSTRGGNLSLTVDSREAQIKGVQVLLLFPIVYRNGAVLISQLDLQTTLQPILSPPRNRSGTSIKNICLDPGHGGKDPGYRVGSRQEKKYTLLLAQEVRDQLSRKGLRASLTRTTDRFVELPIRPETAKRRNADLFVSLHFNAAASSTTTVRGTEVYCLTPPGAPSTNAQGEGSGGWCAGNRYNDKNMFLAYQLQKSLTQSCFAQDRGVRRARFAVLRDALMPAVLIEAGFMSHPEEGRKIFDAGYRRQLARAIVDGLLAYKRSVEQGA